MANLEVGVPITPASAFHVASISKPFTAMSILLLTQQGKLSLDDEVWKHVPEWTDRKNPVTIRHLLTHTSGLRDVFLLRELAPPASDRGDMSPSLVALLARQRGLNFSPGREFQYNNGAYVLLATIVRRVSGHSPRAFSETNIFQPLGMRQTYVMDDPTMIVPNRASGYHREGDRLQAAPHADLGRIGGTTSLHTTTGDLLRWMENFAAVRVGDPALVAAMQQPTPLTDGSVSPYGFGLEIGEHRGLRTISHGGGDPGFAAYVIGYRDRRLGVAVLCNLDNIGFGIGDLTRRVAELFLTDAPPAPTSNSTQTNPAAITLTPEQLASKTGLYHDSANDTYGRIFVRNRKLRAAAGPTEEGDSVELTPVSEHRFVLLGTPIEVEFIAAAAGRPQQARVTGAGPKPAINEQVTTAYAPSPADLRAFAGSYRSDEVGAIYALIPRDADLLVKMPGRPDVGLKPLVPDKFYGSLLEIVKFLRDERGMVTGFTMQTTGVRSLRFDRLVRRPVMWSQNSEHRTQSPD
jgi:CubicO group peptidase (beta-lactamase class C family)